MKTSISSVAVLMVVLFTFFAINGNGQVDPPNKKLSQGTSQDWCIALYNNSGRDSGSAIPDWGYSVFIGYSGKTILFDGGFSAEILKHNAEALGVDLRKVHVAVVSHSHEDHTTGIDYLLSVNKSVKLYLPSDMGDTAESSRKFKQGYRYQYDNIEFVGRNREILPGITLVATTSALTGVFSKYPPNEKDPELWGLPEISLALNLDDGRKILFVGCSHTGVENIVRAVKDSLHSDVALLIGGFHLLPYSAEATTAIAELLMDSLGVERIAPAHCTGAVADSIFLNRYPNKYVYAGLGTKVILPR
jgi:7,8-dihydropterin-6-yl-methyl-4-(beta-D-ribofuranosyl)aminobenzene 5'-phosphate synthase